MPPALPSNFGFLKEHDEQLVRLGRLAERYFPEDPNTCLLKLRQFGELLAQLLATRAGCYVSAEEPQWELLRRLQDQGLLPREVAQLFAELRKTGNSANHALVGDHRTALYILKITWQLGLWYHRTVRDNDYKSGPFIPPTAPKDESAELKSELGALQEKLAAYEATHSAAARELAAAQLSLAAAQKDNALWEALAVEADKDKAELEARLSNLAAEAAHQPASATATLVEAADTAALSLSLDEADTRKFVDSQLRGAGWEVDSEILTHAKGARPLKGTNRAIAEWPTGKGPADYLLFIGLTPVATVEAKRANKNVSSSLQQAARYAQNLQVKDVAGEYNTHWGEFRVPFLFSTNGRPFLKQLETHCGIWFRDARRSTNLARPLDGWHTPEGLLALLKQDTAQAEDRLAADGFIYGFPLRPYQKAAIQAVEQGVRDGRRNMLLAMATGTGKTKTCIALIYRLLKAQRFNRVLFLVDRSALGEQAANAFKDTRMENLNTFAQVFGIKELDEAAPESDTKVHIATVQGMVARVLNPSEGKAPPAVDQYDCIIVDECHRGYLLDRELSDTELQFRGFDEYVSKYRRVIDYFDAVKVGLTATPALHTVQIFGSPIYTYSYREAVIDGFLIDHEPPIQIETTLSAGGIKWGKGEQVQVFNPGSHQVDLFNAPDEIKLEVEEFNKKVITRAFNKVVCKFLATEIDPSQKPKTLIFCANDLHADLVVQLLKEAFAAHYGEVDDDAVIKITGTADKPLELIRRYRNDTMPNVAVTVDLLTTGIDVERICNLVFLRRVNSRILFDQMLGRATRLCDDIGKETFRIFDAVRLYEALGNLTAMQPVVVNPSLSFEQLIAEMTKVKGEDQQQLVLEQLVAKLQRKKHHLSEQMAQDFESCAGATPDGFIKHLKTLSLPEVAKWFTENPDLAEILDRMKASQPTAVLISDHADELKSADHGFGKSQKPKDYLDEFSAFLKNSGNTIPALTAVLSRPRELTRKQLRELKLALDKAGYSESKLAVAWRDMTNKDIAASIIGYIRRSAIGDPLIPFNQRVDQALDKLLAEQKWTKPQRDWLQVIANQTKANQLVDREALNDENLIFRTEGGGFARLNKVFDGKLEQLLDHFNETVWPPAAGSKG